MLEKIKSYIFSQADKEGGFLQSPVRGFIGKADGAVSEIASSVYAAEVAMTLDFELPYYKKTAEYIQKRQDPEGYFRNLAPLPGCFTEDYNLYNTCVALRGLKALGKKPKYNPRKWLDDYILQQDKSCYRSYHPDFYANSCASLEEELNSECRDSLAEFLFSKQDMETGWFMQPGLKKNNFPFERNNPFTFHAVRFLRLAGLDIPYGEKILNKFMEVQEEDGSWKLGYVHGTFDACVAIRILAGNSGVYEDAVKRAANWSAGCWVDKTGGFNHFGKDAGIHGFPPDLPAEMDATYFHVSTLVMGGILKSKLTNENRWIGWGHTLCKD